MATITVVAPKIINAGPGGFCENWTEANSTTVLAGRLSVSNLAEQWAAAASDPALGTLIGRNYVAGANVTTGNPSTTHQVFVTGTVIEINSNATGTDPERGVAYGIVVATNDHQLDQTDTTNDRLIVVRLSPLDATGDTNVRVWARPLSTALIYTAGTAPS